MAISHVGGLLIDVSGVVIYFCMVNLEMNFSPMRLGGMKRPIQVWKLKRPPSEFVEEENIFGGHPAFSGGTFLF